MILTYSRSPLITQCAYAPFIPSDSTDDHCRWTSFYIDPTGVCTTISEAFSRDCRGLVFEPPCPDQYVSDNVIVGNLIVRADPTFGGGELNISGTGMVLDGSYKQYSMMLNASTFAVQVRWCHQEIHVLHFDTLFHDLRHHCFFSL